MKWDSIQERLGLKQTNTRVVATESIICTSWAVLHKNNFYLLEELKHTLNIPFRVVLRHLVDTYGVKPVLYKMTTVTYDVDGCLIVLPTVSTGHISKGRVPAPSYYSRLSAEECKSKRILAILPIVGLVCLISCSFFGMSGTGYHTLVCL
jgi:hypothetical protein